MGSADYGQRWFLSALKVRGAGGERRLQVPRDLQKVRPSITGEPGPADGQDVPGNQDG